MKYIGRYTCYWVVCAVALARVVVAAQLTHPAIGTLTYPDSWHAEVYDPQKGPVELTSFKEHPHGGGLPPGGAEINIQVLSSDQTNESALAKLDLDGTGKRSAQHSGTGPAERLDQTYDRLHERVIALAKRIGGKQFLFILSCNADDPQLPQWEKILLAVVDSVSVGGK